MRSPTGSRPYDIGIPLFAAFLVMDEVPTFHGKTAADTAVSSGLALWPHEVVDQVRAIRDRRPVEGSAWTLIATPSIVDPSRAPEGKHTVKMLVPCSHVAPYGYDSWDDAKEHHADRMIEYVATQIPNVSAAHIEARIVKSPLDIERWNPHMINGCAHGGDKGVPFRRATAARPLAGPATTMPDPGASTKPGGTTHPGGSITGSPGRNAAMVMMKDLGARLPRLGGSGRNDPPADVEGHTRVTHEVEYRAASLDFLDQLHRVVPGCRKSPPVRTGERSGSGGRTLRSPLRPRMSMVQAASKSMRS